ncbi:hypothetical protein EST38_g5534 [Candolleomyces aberdarensis]|uniref:Uncharacterized protein n=1 Tax=Candolleomyces aberdarensis TaxID=2316362 RepID=A0A4Q2DM87_9AGAR|nr:hypothetical protein EST38_g5534 [Candolleomyces aberdarensis]
MAIHAEYRQPYEGQYGECAAWEYTHDPQYQAQYRNPHYPQHQGPRYQYSQYLDPQYSQYLQEQQHSRNQHQQAHTPSPNRHTDSETPPSVTYGSLAATLPRQAQCYSWSESTNRYYQQEGNSNSNGAPPQGQRQDTYYETPPESPVLSPELCEHVDEKRASPQQPPEEFRRENTTTSVVESSPLVMNEPQPQENGSTSGYPAPAHLAQSSTRSSRKGKEEKSKKSGSWITSFFKRNSRNPNLDNSGGDSEVNDTKESKSKSKFKRNSILGFRTK